MVVGNKSDGGQTQESDGGNTICTSSREKSIIVKNIIKQRKTNYCLKKIYHSLLNADDFFLVDTIDKDSDDDDERV